MGDSPVNDAPLFNILASAPRHGMNAKALLLQAAALAAQEAASLEGETPVTVSDREQQIAKFKAAFIGSNKLLTGIPKRESPMVAFVNTAKVPRIVRQQVLQKLAGQHLAASLLDAGLELTAAEVAAKDDLRKAAIAAATEQELLLFKSCQSKASYQNLAARTDASLVMYPPEVALPPNPTPNSIPASGSVPPSSNKTAAVASPDADGLPKADLPSAEEEPHEVASSPEQLPNKKRKLGEPKDVAQDELLDDDIDWAAPSTVAADAAEAPSEAGTSHAAIGDTQGAAQLKAGMQASPHGTQYMTATNADPPDPGNPQRQSDVRRIQHAVNEYIRAFLDPFYKAGIVSKEMYKIVMKKAVAKVMLSHSTDEDTDFLIQESDQIQKLVREYIRYAQKKLNGR